MKNGIFPTLYFLILFPLHLNADQRFELLNMNFQQINEVSMLELVFDRDGVDGRKYHVTDDKQIIIDLDDVRAAQRVMRGFDTSEFAGAVVFIKAYQRDTGVRIVVQLRDNVRSILKQEPRRLALEIENRYGVFSESQVTSTQTFDDIVAISAEEDVTGRIHIPASNSVEDILENLSKSGRKRYVGRRISLNVRDESIENILRMIADVSGFNIIMTEEIRRLPPLTINLVNVPWDQALDTILDLNKLVGRKNGSILMITTLQRATEDQRLEAEARQIAQSEEPILTRVFPLSFASTTEMREILSEYLTPERASISTNERTNSLIVRDTADNLEKMRRIIEVLDTQTPQVLIESKIVEVSENYSKSIGLSDGINWGYDPIGANTTTTGENAGPGFVFSTAAAIGGGVAGLRVSSFGRVRNLGFTLQMIETESKGKIISNPKIVTENNKTATISTSDTRFFRVREVQDSGLTTNTFRELDATLSLQVTPQITNEGSISMQIDLNKQQFGPQQEAEAAPSRQTRQISTNVLVDNGSTIVIGGVYQYETRESVSGVPFFKDLPVIGWLFRSPYNPSVDKNELIVFLTPRIVNQEEASLLSQTR